MPRIVQLCVALLLPLFLEGCQQCRWCPVERELISGTRPVVEPHEVEFLPMLPDTPGTRIVGRFLLQADSSGDLSRESCLQEVRRRAAATDPAGPAVFCAFTESFFPCPAPLDSAAEAGGLPARR